MEGFDTLKQLLDSLFGQKELQSWTIHENGSGTRVTLRFCDSSGASGGAENSRTFKTKSDYQLDRDKQRMERFLDTKRKTRSQTNQDIIENVRSEDSENDFNLLSNTALSAQCSDLDSSACSFRLDADTPGVNPDHTVSTMECTPLSMEPIIDLPSLDSVENTDSRDQPCIQNKELADTFKNDMFYEHLTNRSEISFRDIKCHNCRSTVPRHCINMGVRWRGIRMLYCE